MIRTRFPPSPTGFVHVGSLRTALFPYLFAKKNGGTFVIRIEDTDQERLVPGAVENLLRTLEWAGLDVDEGPFLKPDGTIAQKGEYGPYVQSERLPLYQKHAAELVEKGFAYYAFDTAEELDAMRKNQEAHKLVPRYDRMRMRNSLTLPKDEVEKMISEKTAYVVRFKVPEARDVMFKDVVRGEVSFNTKEIDDTVLLKSDGFPTYHLAVVVDDNAMKITHVIRGEEWLSSTPKHVLLYEAFGWPLPVFAHLPLLVDDKKQKLSKRNGDVAVESYREKGYLPEAFVNFIALLGWNPGGDKELFTLAELTQEFSLERVQKASAFFNVEKLNWFNKEYMKKLLPEDLATRAMPWFLKDESYKPFASQIKNNLAWFAKVLMLERERVTTLADLPSAVKFVFLLPDFAKELLVWRKGTLEEVQTILPQLEKFLASIDESDWNKTSLEIKIGEWVKANNFSTGSVLWPMRVSLSGQQNSPGPYEIAEVLGKTESQVRIQKALQKIA